MAFLLNTIVCVQCVSPPGILPSMVEKAFSVVLRRLRESRGLSQEELGFESNLHRTYVSQLERAMKSPSLDTLWKLAKALQVSPREIVQLVEEEIRGRQDTK